MVSGYVVMGNIVLLVWDDFKCLVDLYVVKMSGYGLCQVIYFNVDWMCDVKVGDFEFFSFIGVNNELVQGYVVKLVGYQCGKIYLVVFIIYGGLQGVMNNGWSYCWNLQIYVGQGFVVVMVNFYGFIGYGQVFINVILGDWGGRLFEDFKVGWSVVFVKYCFFDGDCVCVLGVSYGGYMVYWMVGVWNGLWKCFVDYDGVFDICVMYYDIEELWFEERENGGILFEYFENYECFNFVNYVKDWCVLMLVVYSGNDFCILIIQGLGVFIVLQCCGIFSEFFIFFDENYFVFKLQNSVQWYEVVNVWLKKWMVVLVND